VILGKLIRKNLLRRRGRSLLTLLGVASALLLLVLVDSLGRGLERALSGSEAARTLIVYRQNRYCPQTSNLPEYYAERIRRLPGVRSALPVKVYLNNCRASLDLVAFHGVPVDRLAEARSVALLDGDLERFRRERDAALVGRAFAQRRGLKTGDKFRFGNITLGIAGTFASDEPVEEGVVLTHLEFLQRSGPVNLLGTVTQIEVKVDDGAQADQLAARIDELFRTAEQPTDTRSKVQFLATATRDLREILAFARWLGLACVLVVLALVGNTVLMSVQERVREFGVLRTVGFHARHLLQIVLGEALLLAVAGAGLGLLLAVVLVRSTHLTIGVEGVSVPFTIDPAVAGRGLLLAAATGLLAAAAPAWFASRRDVVEALRV
jgi:putative ABC transport system permease protein